ncbi:MAG TPA: recombinase A [bacterium]|nr:recombinase A [bacterium]
MSAAGEAAALRRRFAQHLVIVPSRGKSEKRTAEDYFSLTELSGRLIELSADGNAASLTFAFHLVREAQQAGETCAWVTPINSTFYPPDAALADVDLAALVVVRCPDSEAVTCAADKLARSGAFGLIVLDLAKRADVPLAHLSRLAGLAGKHHLAIVFLTGKRQEIPSLGSLISLRAETGVRQTEDRRFTCYLQAVRDKRHGSDWEYEVDCHAPAGLY